MSQPDPDYYRREIASLRERLARALKMARRFASQRRRFRGLMNNVIDDRDQLHRENERLRFAHGHINDRWIDGVDDRAELRRQRDLATQLLESIVDAAKDGYEVTRVHSGVKREIPIALLDQAERLVKPLVYVTRDPGGKDRPFKLEATSRMIPVGDAKVQFISPMGIEDGPVRIAVSAIDNPLGTYAIHNIAQLHRDIEGGQAWLKAYAEHIESALKTSPRPVHLVPASEIDVHYRIGC